MLPGYKLSSVLLPNCSYVVQAFVEQLEREGFRVLSRVALGAGDLA